MKVSREQAAANRAAVVKAASRLFRSHGFDGVGVAEITRAAGLTHGGFYGQFASKDALAEEACDQAFAETVRPPAGKAGRAWGGLARLLAAYLSTWHRDQPGDGCPMAAYGSEIARQPLEVQTQFAAGVRRYVEELAVGSRKGWRRYRATAPSPGHSSRAGGRSYTGARHGTRGSRAIRRAVGRLENQNLRSPADSDGQDQARAEVPRRRARR